MLSKSYSIFKPIKVLDSVAMVMTDAFEKKIKNYKPRKLVKTVRIFVETIG